MGSSRTLTTFRYPSFVQLENRATSCRTRCACPSRTSMIVLRIRPCVPEEPVLSVQNGTYLYHHANQVHQERAVCLHAVCPRSVAPQPFLAWVHHVHFGVEYGVDAFLVFLYARGLVFCAARCTQGSLPKTSMGGTSCCSSRTKNDRSNTTLMGGLRRTCRAARLMERGITFNNAYTNSVTCSSSRACMLTGLMPAQHGVRYKLRNTMANDEYPQEDMPTDVANLATIAMEAGYTTVSWWY